LGLILHALSQIYLKVVFLCLQEFDLNKSGKQANAMLNGNKKGNTELKVGSTVAPCQAA